MSTPARTPVPPKRFDMAKFETMVEPFNVRVERIKGSMKYEIPLPVSEDGQPPGTGWSRAQVREVEKWLVTEWAGGGHYGFAITDSSAPPQSMEWIAYYPPAEFPEKTPPTLVQAFQPTGPIPGSVGSYNPNSMRMNMATFPGGGSLPSAAMYPHAQPVAGLAPQPPSPYFQPQFYAQPAPMPTPSNEATALREALAQAREQAAQREFERRLTEMKAESERRFLELQQTMQQMVKEMSAAVAVKQPTVDPATEVMRAELAALREQTRRQQEEAERTRREQELREQIRSSQEQMARIVEESNRRLETFMQQAANKGPDSQVLMFQQMFQAQMDAMKEMSRESRSTMDRVQAFMMRPQDVLAIAKESSTSQDHVVMNLNRQWEQMFAISRQLTEQAAQLNQGGGGNEVIGLIRDAGGQLAEMARKYTGDKTKENIASVNAQAEIAKAQADLQKSQMERMAEMARMEAAMKSGVVATASNGVHYAPPGTQQAAIPAVIPARPWMPPKVPRTDNAAVPLSGLGGTPSEPATNVVPLKPDDANAKRVKGRTDLEWFGPILPNVKELRAEVAAFIQALEDWKAGKLTEGEAKKLGANPSECATAIQLAAQEIMKRQIAIPAMIDLLLQGSVADFLDVLLPDAPQPYRDDVVQILMREDDDDDDEDDGDGDDGGGDEGEAEGASAS